MRIVVEVVVFLDLSGDDVVDPDAALSMLEWVSATLRELDDDERARLIAFVEREAERAETEPLASDARRTFLRELPVAIGLREPDD